MKSALANIGEPELSAVAFELEQAGRDKNTAVMSAETGAFLDELRGVIGKLALKGEGEDNEATDADIGYLSEKLLAVQEACSTYDKKTAKSMITELREKAWPRHTKELLSAISEHLLNGDFEEAVGIAGKIINQDEFREPG